ncbi:MAG: PilZ domain-containing protein [Myxococcota bacterium]
MSQNRRSHVRHTVNIEIDLQVPQHNIKEKVKTRDLSKGGLCFSFDKPLNMNDQLELGLSLILGPEAQSETLYLKAQVAWCSQEEDRGQYQIGAAFNNHNDDEINSNIETFLEFLQEGFEVNLDE